MSERRWGRVTVEGWVRQDGSLVSLWKQRDGGWPYLELSLAPTDRVEFLPEPVTFKDGDVLQSSPDPIQTYVRRDGQWEALGRPSASLFSDDLLRDWMAQGRIRRLVPEGATGG